MRFHALAVRIDFMSRMGIWLWRAVSPIVASSPGQRPGDGVCIDLSIALCKSSLHYEGQRPVALRVTRSGRVAFLRHRRKNAECIDRGVRFPRALPGAMGNIWALHNVGCARHSPNKFGSALACTTFQPALTIAIRRVRRASSQSSSYSLTPFWRGSSDAPPSARPFRCAGARDRGSRTGNRG